MYSTTSLSATELAAVLEQLPIGVAVIDRDGRPLLINAAARELVGPLLAGSEQWLEMGAAGNLRDTHTNEVVRPEATPMRRALAGETVSGEELTGTLPNSQKTVQLRVSSQPLRGRDDEIVGGMSTFADITSEVGQARRATRLYELEQRARAQTEQAMAQLEQELAERRRAEEELLRSEQRLRLALQASHMATCATRGTHHPPRPSQELVTEHVAPAPSALRIEEEHHRGTRKARSETQPGGQAAADGVAIAHG